MLITTPRIFGYQITEPIHVSLRTLVYRAVRNLDAQAVVIKILHREYPSFSDLVQFRNQYTISRNLNIDRIIKPYSLEAYQNGYALVMEDYGGISLNKFILENLLTVDQFLRIAIQIADALHQLHTKMVVHKDIKPANILINPSTKQIKLTDFSIASLLPRETQENQITHFLSGTLAYMSPEQTGRMNRGIDYRTDFYSLGVTFYELLTGQLPFQPQDAIELIHCHIAQRPPQIQQLNPQVPSILSDILLKLMAKNAEDRYQSALGLHDDLVTCLDKLESTGEIASFRIGQYDLCDRFCIPEKLYGREQEVQMLLAAFRRVTQGKAELMLVAGFSGIGKTAVVNEVHKPIVEKHGFFIKGKFDQLQRNIPFIAFVKAFRDLIKQLLCEPAEQVCQWQSKILQALGETAQVIVEVIPELENLIGKQPAVLELSGDAAQNRFNRLFQKFVQVFTSESHPLVIFLDDLQWADSGSFKLLELLLDDTEHLLLLGAYRDNEVSSIHPLMLTVEKIRKLGATVNTITLNPLNLANTNQLVADTLNCQGFIVQPLAELIYQKTKGNPFFTSQFLKVLHEDGFIEFNQSVGYWQCDISQIKVRASTDDVVEFMAQQLQKLPRETQNVLQLAACLGAQFDLSTLAIVSKKSEIDTGIALWKALQLGLIVPLNETYKLYQEDDLGEVQTTAPNSQNIQVPYKFLHDRVQQAAYYLIPPHQRSQVHYQIGKLLLQINEPTTREDGIFAIVNQLNYGIELITQESERDQLVELNILALRKARVSVAYQAARDYAQTALNLMGEGGWQRHNETCLILHKLAADLAFICGDLAGMNRLVQVVIDHTKTPLERVEVYLVKMQALAAGRDFAGVVLFGKSIVQEFGVTLLENPTREDIQQALQEVQALIGKRTIEELFHLPKMVDAEKLAITNVLSGMVTACYLSGSPLFSMVVTLQVKLSIQYGNSPMSASGYTFYGILLCNFAQDLIASSEFGHLAYQLAAHPEAKEIRSLTSVLLGMFIFHRTAHLRETVPIFQASHQVGLDTGKLEPAGYNVTAFCINAFWCGYPLVELESQIRAYYQRLVDLNLLSIAGSTRLFWEVVLFLLDNPDNIELSWEQNLHEANLNDPVRLFYFLLHKAILKFWMGDFTQALTNIKQAKNYLVAARSMVLEASLYFYESLIYLNMVNEMGVDLSTHMQDVDLNQAQLQLWAEHAPMNYLHKWQLVAAEKARVLGQKAEAIELYDCAIAQAKQHDYIQEAGLANELASKFYLAWGKEKLAATYMQEAYYCYSRWGAKAKIIHLEQLYPHLLNPILHSTPSEALNLRETLDKISNTSNKTNQLDLITVIKASQALSEEINLDNLLHKLLGVVIENAGAETGYLILHQRENRLLIAAKRTLENPQLVFERVVEYDANEYFPKSIIRYVENTREDIVINDATSEELFIRDPYIKE